MIERNMKMLCILQLFAEEQVMGPERSLTDEKRDLNIKLWKRIYYPRPEPRTSENQPRHPHKRGGVLNEENLD